MNINCTIDGINHQINASTVKPLNLILQEYVFDFPSNYECKGANCGNCIVLVNEQPVVSCLVPAFILDDAKIITFGNFRDSLQYEDIRKAYKETGFRPCSQCIAAKTLLIESILRRMEKYGLYGISSAKSRNEKIKMLINRDFIEKELSINKCRCVDISSMEKIINAAYKYRKKRNDHL